eukprot:1183591-Prorocentrum_minimum.AAC.1
MIGWKDLGQKVEQIARLAVRGDLGIALGIGRKVFSMGDSVNAEALYGPTIGEPSRPITKRIAFFFFAAAGEQTCNAHRPCVD